ncbi:MAG TPA: hypothetical protein DEA55_08515 [Rhodospirillaceae bacterium]|nr:hypothetical protein [Rhodospirillaceae bacterium]
MSLLPYKNTAKLAFALSTVIFASSFGASSDAAVSGKNIIGYKDERKNPLVRLTCDPGYPFRNVQEMKETAFRRGYIEYFEKEYYGDILNSAMAFLTASNSDSSLCYAAAYALRNERVEEKIFQEAKYRLFETMKSNNLFKVLVNALRETFLMPPEEIVFRSDVEREMLVDMLKMTYANYEDVMTEALARMMVESMLYNYEESAELFHDLVNIEQTMLSAKNAGVRLWQGITGANSAGFFPAVQ